MSVKKLASAAAIFGARPVAAVEAAAGATAGGGTGGAPAAGAGFDSGGNEDGALGSDIGMCDEVKTRVISVNPSRQRLTLQRQTKDNFAIYVGKRGDYTEIRSFFLVR
jgi:hypothetical protein